MINTFAKKEIAKVGEGDGYSTTKEIRKFNIKLDGDNLLFLDARGIGDTDVSDSDMDINL